MSSPETGMHYTGERFIPEVDGVVALEHLHRYFLVREAVADKVVLDIASGEGYGASILAEKASQVIGVDISPEAVEHANKRYGSDKLNYLHGSCSAIPLEDSSVDVIVSYETIEHHDAHDAMMEEILRVLKPEGFLVISSPDKYYYSELPGKPNPYHVKELYRDEFESLLGKYFSQVSICSQRVVYGSLVSAPSCEFGERTYLRGDSSGKVSDHSSIPEPLYHIAWASNSEIPHVKWGLFEQSDWEVGNSDWYEGEVAKRDKQIADAHHIINKHSETITDLTLQLENSRSESERLASALSETEQREARLKQTVDEVGERALVAIRMARKIKRNLILEQGSRSRMFVARLAHGAWEVLPISPSLREQIKTLVFSTAPSLFSGTHSYQSWLNFKQMAEEGVGLPVSEPSVDGGESYVPKWTGEHASALSAKVICLYLPQFHPIPENDEWWGEGFTEWTNVKPSTPLFRGHYQPHVPGELGYYDLRSTEIQRRQIDLARLYGISGFCFYFYWFGGKTLLEDPIDNYLTDKTLDFPFCLCWANENWSRRWDGLDHEILISQSHSSDDDMAFIKHISKYLRDERYIRVDGKPLLIVYRPNLLPDARATGQRWREWCLEEGIGEIYLAYTQSFEAVDPSVYGFDAAIEFPPNTPKGHSVPPNITSQCESLGHDFEATVYDWRALVAKSRDYVDPGYPIIRSVNPGWDNTPRRKSKGTVFLHSSPVGYQEWLVNAIRDTKGRVHDADSRFVFVNAWNEWAEGAHLEPDQKYGYAYLEATRMAHIRTSEPDVNLTSNRNLGVVIHAFYVDIFEEIIARLQDIDRGEIKLYVTTPHSQFERVECILRDSGFEYTLRAVENRGRDILPFLIIMKDVIRDGCSCILKLHTKKSTHRPDGVEWRNDLFDKLISASAVSSVTNILKKHADIGVIGPAGHVVSMATFWGSNHKLVMSLSHRLGQSIEKIRPLSFVAGSMFYARVEALRPLLNIELPVEAFDVEAGQVDGTLAHALERVISISASAVGMRTVSTDCLDVAGGADSYPYADSGNALQDS